MMKNRLAALRIVCAFRLHIENLFDQKIKVFQLDGAKEFLSHEFQKELQANGTFHRISCPHVPQKKGSIRRKHRHIIDTNLTLLYHASLPPKF